MKRLPWADSEYCAPLLGIPRNRSNRELPSSIRAGKPRWNVKSSLSEFSRIWSNSFPYVSWYGDLCIRVLIICCCFLSLVCIMAAKLICSFSSGCDLLECVCLEDVGDDVGVLVEVVVVVETIGSGTSEGVWCNCACADVSVGSIVLYSMIKSECNRYNYKSYWNGKLWIGVVEFVCWSAFITIVKR